MFTDFITTSQPPKPQTETHKITDRHAIAPTPQAEPKTYAQLLPGAACCNCRTESPVHPELHNGCRSALLARDRCYINPESAWYPKTGFSGGTAL